MQKKKTYWVINNCFILIEGRKKDDGYCLIYKFCPRRTALANNTPNCYDYLYCKCLTSLKKTCWHSFVRFIQRWLQLNIMHISITSTARESTITRFAKKLESSTSGVISGLTLDLPQIAVYPSFLCLNIWCVYLCLLPKTKLHIVQEVFLVSLTLATFKFGTYFGPSFNIFN